MAAYRLARPRASSNPSHTTIRSWRALAFAGVILAGTCYVLFQDVINGAPITTGHVLTAMALLIATGAGHQIMPTFRDRRYPLSVAFVILAAGAVIYVGLMSGARNAEFTASKAERIEGSNAERTRIGKLREEAQAMLSKALKDVAEKCVGGVGKNCKGAEKTRDVYEAAVKGHNAELAKLGTPQTANAGYKAIAEGIVLLPWFAHYTIAQVEHGLIILLPWLAVLLAELSVPAFLSLALGHAHLPTHVRTLAVSDMTLGECPTDRYGRNRSVTFVGTSLQSPAPQQLSTHVAPANDTTHQQPRHLPALDIVTALVAIGRPATVGELARAMCVTPGEASRRWREAGNRVTARRDGKFMMIGLPEWQARAVG